MNKIQPLSLFLLALSGAVGSSVPARAASPLFEETAVFTGGQDGVLEYRIPGLITSSKGTLLAYCDARVKKAGDPPNYIRLVMKRSTDGGKTWGPLQTLVDPGKGAVADSCGLVDRQTGAIWLFSDYCPVGVGGGNAARGLSGLTVFYKVIRSDDDGITWSAPVDITAKVKRPAWRAGSFGPGRGFQMEKGRLVVPRYFTTSAVGAPEQATSSVIYSDDDGLTWQMGGETETGGTTNECQGAELADGTLLLNMRGITGNHRRIARSRDGGVTWSAVAEDPVLIEPRCQASLMSFMDASGKVRLLFSNPASTTRKNMTVRLSNDGGRTWAASKVLFAGPSAYSCLSALSDMTVGCLYERGDKKPYERIEFVRFSLDWLSGGALP